jgi:hypothetical protein
MIWENCGSNFDFMMWVGYRGFYAPCVRGMVLGMGIRAWRIKRAAVTVCDMAW